MSKVPKASDKTRHATDQTKRLALEALRRGDFDVALHTAQSGEAGIADLVEDLKIYQTELELQNAELRQAQLQSEAATRHFNALFSLLPLPALVVDEFGMVLDCNQVAEEALGLASSQIRNHSFPRMLQKQEQLRLRRAVAKTGFSGKECLQDVAMKAPTGKAFTADLHLSALPDPDPETHHFAVVIVDRSDWLVREQLLSRQSLELRERIKQLGAIYAISRAAHHAVNEGEFLDEVIEHLPAGMLYPDDVLVQLSFAGKVYQTPNYTQPADQITVKIAIPGGDPGELKVGYSKPHDDGGDGAFYAEERQFVVGAVELIARFTQGVQDRQARDLAAKRNAALIELTTGAVGLNDDKLIRFAIDQAESMTASAIGYAHLVNDDQETLTLGTWSSRTQSICKTSSDNHYPISRAGVWADCFRQMRPVVHNCYETQHGKQGLPAGHAHLSRHVSVPVMEGGKVKLIFGVGNKSTDYDAGDVALLEVLANNLWLLLQRNRGLRKLELDAEVFRMSREAVMITDASGTIISVNDAFAQITGYSPEEAIGQTPRLLKSGKHEADFYRELWGQILSAGHWQGEIWNRRKNGELYPQWLGISVAKNDRGAVTEYIAIFMDISDHKRAQDRIEQLGYYDALTGLANRRLLNERTVQVLSLARRQHHQVGLIYLDLDHFKDVNDGMGHLVGDELLKYVAIRLQGCVRATDTVCRMGGDEFVVLLTKVDNPDNVADACNKVLSALAEPFEFNQHMIRISCSIGASVYPVDGDNFEILLQHADTAMYQAKADGRNNFKMFTEAMNARVQHRLKLQFEMKLALEQKEFFVEYQPQFDLQSRHIVAVEALVRWRHPRLGTVAPGEFIPIAEESQLIVDIGDEVMRQACQQARRWFDTGHRICVAVNVSYMQFVRSDLLQLVESVLAESGLPAELLELELTESILIADPENVLDVVRQLRDMGVTLSIDDFGTGYSSLSYLKRFCVHKLKIDRSFIRDILTDPDDSVIVAAIINLAKNLQIECVAEGVESEQQALRLGEMGCQHIQGYWLARPLPAEGLDALLADSHHR